MYQFSSDESRFFQFDKIKKKDEQELMWMSDVVEPKDPSKIIQVIIFCFPRMKVNLPERSFSSHNKNNKNATLLIPALPGPSYSKKRTGTRN